MKLIQIKDIKNQESKNYKLPFRTSKMKEWRLPPKRVDPKKYLYASLELGIGTAMEVQKIKHLPKGYAKDIKSIKKIRK